MTSPTPVAVLAAAAAAAARPGCGSDIAAPLARVTADVPSSSWPKRHLHRYTRTVSKQKLNERNNAHTHLTALFPGLTG